MVALLLSCAVLAGFGAGGIGAVRRLAPALDPLEQLAYGVPLGAVLCSLALLGLASLFSWSATLVWALGGLGLLLGARSAWRLTAQLGAVPRGAALVSLLVLLLFSLRWLVFWSGALTVDATGLWAGERSLWGDAALHLGDVASFAYGGNFPPVHPRFADHAFNYHYLTSITAAAFVSLGMPPWTALCLHGWIFSSWAALGVIAFARRLGASHATASLALVLLMLGGGLSWCWDPRVRWLNVYFALIAPQRGWLYGIPLGLLTLRLLDLGEKRKEMGSFVAAGVVAGLLPFAHLGTLLALALLVPVLAVAFPTRRWFAFFGVWALVAAPQLYAQQAGSVGAAGAFRWSPGWVAPPEPWLVFWLKNLGLFLPLLIFTFSAELDLSPRARRFLLAFQPLFLASNLFIFQPWDWDNTKILLWWFLASSLLVAALLSRSWRLRPLWLSRPAIVLVVLSLIASGVVDNVKQAAGASRNRLLTTEELGVAVRLRELTDPHALFAVGLRHNHPVPMLTGRRVLMGYPGWLWSQGIDSKTRERELTAIMKLAPESSELLARYGVDYVVVGPDEVSRFGADPEAWRARYPSALTTDHYEVFAISRSASDRLPGGKPQP